MTYAKPLSISNLAVTLKDIVNVTHVEDLLDGKEIEFTSGADETTIHIEQLSMFASLAITQKPLERMV